MRKVVGLPQVRVHDLKHTFASLLIVSGEDCSATIILSGSYDLEDVICVIDGRPGMEDEVRGSATDVRQYICSRLKDLLKQQAFLEALPGHLPGDPGSQARLPGLVSKLERLAGA